MNSLLIGLKIVLVECDFSVWLLDDQINLVIFFYLIELFYIALEQIERSRWKYDELMSFLAIWSVGMDENDLSLIKYHY